MPPEAEVPPPAAGEDALDHARGLLRRHDRDRYLTTLFAPRERRPTLLALLAFNLEVARTREAVSEPTLGEIRLQWWREALAEAYAGTPRRHPTVQLMAATLPQSGLAQAALADLIDARSRDLDPRHFPDLAALAAYAGRTAGALLQQSVRALGVPPGAELDRTATAIGTAYGLTGLVRAVPFHARHNRLYLPLDLLRAGGLRPDQIRPERSASGLPGVIRPIIEHAARCLAEARRLEPPPAAARPALLLDTVTEQQMRRLRRAGDDPYALAPGRDGLGGVLQLCLRAWSGRF